MFGGDDQLLMMVIVGGGTLLVTLILGFAFVGGDGSSAALKRRLSEVGNGTRRAPDKVGHRSSARIQNPKGSSQFIDALARKMLPKPAELRSRLEKTGFNISIAQYFLITVAAVVLLTVMCRFVYGFSLFLAIPVALAGGMFIPHFIIGFLGRRRINKFMKAFPEAIELLCRGLRAGLPISEAINTVGHDSPEPVGKEFRVVADTVRMGRTVEDGLWDVSRRIDLPDFKFLIIAISIQRETGGNLAETLGGLASTLRKRRQIKLKIKAMSSEARASAWIIGSLPFIMFFLLWLANDSYVMTLIHDPRGIYMIGAGLTMIGFGVMVMAKMVRFEI
ncbi:type II secretion system F family protein [Sneathiella chinensis]|uniref:Pilus assembly protein n=1 Tax=Sneathiella chinensis TaxID=349750 RepID=A0ABQ5U7X5_9PROT|nr:type II secretion system F family protein [Sneathiella chinensis]GLQ06566.1 pilus assembly protein [Sneathiella chinensis]